MHKVIIYTAIVGGYDLLPQVVAEEGIEYYCFTDTIPKNANGWNCVYIPSFFKDNKLTVGFVKTNAHILFGSEVIAVWIDANTDTVELTKATIFSLLEGYGISTLVHRYRRTVLGEAAIIVEHNLDSQNKVLKWESELKSLGFPDDQGLGETCILIRDLRNPAVRNFNETWWKFLINGSRRDQLSFMCALWYINLEGKFIKLEDVDSKRPEFLKYIFKEHTNSTKRVIGNGFPAFDPEEYAPYCWTELRTEETDKGKKEFYLVDSERWTLQTLEGIRALNRLAQQHKVIVRDHYCYLHQQNISEYSVPDLRYAWKREYLRRSVLPSQWGIEIGFGHGYSSAILLGYHPLLSLIAVESKPDPLTYGSEKILKEKYGRRLEVYYGKTGGILQELSEKLPLGKIEFLHYNLGISDLEEIWSLLEWYLCKASVGCRLIISDFTKEISVLMKFILLSGSLDQLNPGIADLADNKQFIKVHSTTLEEFHALRSLYNRRPDDPESMTMTMIASRLSELTVRNAKLVYDHAKAMEELIDLSEQHQELKNYTAKLENPFRYWGIKLRKWMHRLKG